MIQAVIYERTLVTYHGSVTEAHGRTFTAWRCGCPDQRCGTARYELDDLRTDETVLRHVRRPSISPAV